MTVTAIPMSAILLAAKPLLMLGGQTPEVAETTAAYIRCAAAQQMRIPIATMSGGQHTMHAATATTAAYIRCAAAQQMRIPIATMFGGQHTMHAATATMLGTVVVSV